LLLCAKNESFFPFSYRYPLSTIQLVIQGAPFLKSSKFDPLAYIENAFLDRKTEKGRSVPDQDGEMGVNIPSIGDYIGAKGNRTATPAGPKTKFRKTVMSAPRPRRTPSQPATSLVPKIDPELQTVWMALPKNVEFLCSFYDDSVTANYYRGEFKETRQELIKRLLDPELSLEETSRLLGVCPATVRRYTNRGWLAHHRTTGGQRRFRLSDIVKFVEVHGRFPEV